MCEPLTAASRRAIAKAFRQAADQTEFGNSALANPDRTFTREDIAASLRARADRVIDGTPEPDGTPVPVAGVDRCTVCGQVFGSAWDEPLFLWTRPPSWCHRGCG